MAKPYVDYSAFDEASRHVHALVQAELAAMGPKRRAEVAPGAANIRGVGYTRGLCIFLERTATEDEVRHELRSHFRVPPALIASIEIELVVAGDPIVTAQKYRPVPGGSSGSNVNGEAGTLGCLTIGLSGTWKNKLQILGNNHILARLNDGNVGDPIIQPGRGAGGNPGDQVATLAQWVPIHFNGRLNYMDAATAYVADEALVTPQILDIARTRSSAGFASVGQPVQKSSAVSGHRTAKVLAIGVSQYVNVGNESNPRFALFADMIVAGKDGLLFQAGGDSGSILWTNTDPAVPLALMLANGTYNNITYSGYGSPISGVLDVLNLEIIPYG